MSLNIRDEETEHLARELASLTGESLAVAVSIALRERLERIKQQQGGGLVERIWRSGGTAPLT